MSGPAGERPPARAPAAGLGPPGSGDLAPGRGPRLVFYEVTRRCPLACVHCRARAQTEALPGELSTSEALRWIEELPRFGAPLPVLVLTGGDPLARPDLFELIGAARAVGAPVAVSPAVSPSLTPAMLERLARAEVTAVSFSLDGASAATHEAIRQQAGVFEATVGALRRAVDLGFRVQVNTTVLPPNVEELPRIFRLVRDLGLAAWEVFFLIRTGRATTLAELAPEEYEAVGQFLYDASRYGVPVRVIEAPFVRRIVLQRRRGPPEGLSPVYATLSSELEATMGGPDAPTTLRPHGPLDGDGTIFVRHDGTIFPGGFAEYALGSVRRELLADVYRDHPALERIRRRDFRGPCGSCPFRSRCGGSRGRAFAVAGDLFGSDPACVFGERREAAPSPLGEVAPRPASGQVG